MMADEVVIVHTYSFIVMGAQLIEVVNAYGMVNFLVIMRNDYELVTQHLNDFNVQTKN